VRVFSLVENYK